MAAASSQAAISVTLSDPQNDTLGTLNPQLDIKELRVDAVDSSGTNPGNTHLKFTLSFYTPISPPSGAGADALYGMILIDIDNDADMAAVLEQLIVNPFLDLASNGVEYFIDLSSEQIQLGFVDVVETSTMTATSASPHSITYLPSFFDVFVTSDRDDLGVTANNDVDITFGAIVGTASEPTDVVPNIPEPASSLLACGLLGLPGWQGRRRRWRQ